MGYNYSYKLALCSEDVTMFIKDWKKDICSIPNLLSLLRLILIPVYVTIYLNAREATDYYLSAGILAVSCLTDLIDGKIARHFNMITALGKVLDPLADKLTQFTLILCLALKAESGLLWYLIGLFVLKESFQLIAGGIRLRKGIMLKGALLSGKICTTILFVSLIIMVMMPDMPVKTMNIITIVDAVFLLIAFVHYAVAYFCMDNKFQAVED